MSDIVQWLRNSDESLLDDYRTVCSKYGFPNRLEEAADEIERLRAELKQYRLAETRRRCERMRSSFYGADGWFP